MSRRRNTQKDRHDRLNRNEPSSPQPTESPATEEAGQSPMRLFAWLWGIPIALIIAAIAVKALQG